MMRLLSAIITAISALVASGLPFTLRTRTALIRSSEDYRQGCPSRYLWMVWSSPSPFTGRRPGRQE
jgi:hypothetical protein